MGRWMEVLRRRPPPGAMLPDYRPDILGEAVPYPLLDATRRMPKALRPQFPQLCRVQLRSEFYEDEEQFLSSREAGLLLEELLLLRRLCRREAFLPGFDAAKFYQFWRGLQDAGQFEASLNHVEDQLQLAVREGAWVRIML